MIVGIGIDLVEVVRFKKWIQNPQMIERFFNKNEISFVSNCELSERQISALSQKLAVRFAAKEAFSKAIGTGITGFDLKDLYVLNEPNGKPYLVLENSAKELFDSICKSAKIHLSLSHEKEYAIANVIIEN